MNDNFIINNKNRNKVLNVFLDNIALKIVNNYLSLLEKDNNIPEPILSFLDQSIYLTRKKINIEKIKPKIKYMNEEETNELKNILKIKSNYEKIYKNLRILLFIIKEEEIQKMLFSFIYNDFIQYKKEKELKKKKNIENILKKIIPNINQNFNYKYLH